MRQWRFTTVYGTREGEELEGTEGVDLINGFGGNDVIFGGDGSDLLIGGGGADHFVYTYDPDLESSWAANPGMGTDIIYDFNREEGDRIDLSALSAATGGKLTFTEEVHIPYTKAPPYSIRCYSTVNLSWDDPLPLFRLPCPPGHVGVTLLADMDGDERGNADFALIVMGIETIIASDLIL